MPVAGEVGLHFPPDGEDLLPFLVAEPHGSPEAGEDGGRRVPSAACSGCLSPKGWLESSPAGFIVPPHRPTPVNRQLDILLSFRLV